MSTSFWGDSGGFLDELDGDYGDGADGQTQGELNYGRDGLILLIDATKPMFQVNKIGESPFKMCLKCAKNILMGKAISSDNDLIGILFFGTEKGKNANDFKNIYVFQDLELPDAKRIKDLESLMEDIDDGAFEDSFGHNQSFSMSDVLWACSSIFANCNFKLGNRRVMLFTNTDDPHELNQELKRRALRKAKDLSDLGIFIDLMHMEQPGKKFDGRKFYKDVVFCDEDEDVGDLPDPSEKFEELLSRVQGKDYKKRAITRLPFKLAQEFEFGVAVYALCRSASRPSYVKIDSRTNEEVKTVTKLICEDTGQELMPTDIKFSQDFGGEKVTFEKNEVHDMKRFGDPGLHLLGFKSKSFMKSYYYVKPGLFLYPDETILGGSRTVFAALLKRCLAKNVVPICVYIPRLYSIPRIVALVPQKEKYDDHGYQVKPSGFNLKFLPFSDDIRKLKVEEAPKATNEQIDKAKEILTKLKFEFSSESFENPILQRFFRTLEALALDKDDIEETVDTTAPNTEIMEKKAGAIMKEFNDMIFPAGYDANSGKRKASTNQGAAQKKPKIELSDIDIEKEAQNNRLSQLTVPILKEFCQSKKIKPASAKKADLITAIMTHFQL